MVGALLAALQLKGLTARINTREDASSWHPAVAGGKEDWFSRWVARPVRAGGDLIWRLTRRIGNEHIRAGLRVALGLSLGLCALTIVAVVAWAVLMAVIVLAVLVLLVWVPIKVLASGGGSTQASRQGSPVLGDLPTEPVSMAAVGLRGTRLMNEGVVGTTPVGVRIDNEGRILKEGVFGDAPSGYRLDDEGRLIKEGIFGESPRGQRLADDGRVLKEGVFAEAPAGLRVNEDGRIVEEGVFGDSPTGQRFEKN